jgi:hypothetical protein
MLDIVTAMQLADQMIILNILADTQTSGGLPISLPEDGAPALLNGLIVGGVPNAAAIGRATVVEREGS